MNNQQIAFALGLAQKAGRVASGDFAVRGALKAGRVTLLVIATDTAENTKKELLYLAEQAGVQVMEALTKAEMGYAIGKAQRTAVALTDENFARMLKK